MELLTIKRSEEAGSRIRGARLARQKGESVQRAAVMVTALRAATHRPRTSSCATLSPGFRGSSWPHGSFAQKALTGRSASVIASDADDQAPAERREACDGRLALRWQ